MSRTGNARWNGTGFLLMAVVRFGKWTESFIALDVGVDDELGPSADLGLQTRGRRRRAVRRQRVDALREELRLDLGLDDDLRQRGVEPRDDVGRRSGRREHAEGRADLHRR